MCEDINATALITGSCMIIRGKQFIYKQFAVGHLRIVESGTEFDKCGNALCNFVASSHFHLISMKH